MNNKAIWFSRHQPTADQLADAERFGYTLTAIADGVRLGSENLQSSEDALRVADGIRALCAANRAKAVFGVWSVDFQHMFATTNRNRRALPCFAAANLMRSEEGGKPTFSHREWLYVGHLGE